jgi:hypothetical protein
MVKQFSYTSTKCVSIFSILPNKRMSKYLRNIGFTWAVSYNKDEDKNYLRLAYREPSNTEEKELISLNKKMNEIANNCIDFTLLAEDSNSNNIMTFI